jgi:hypothetical protein
MTRKPKTLELKAKCTGEYKRKTRGLHYLDSGDENSRTHK